MAQRKINHLLLALAGLHLAHAQDTPANFGPPPDSDPLTWGFYATPEMQQPAELEIEGNFPSWLTGSLYRGAAATWDVGNFTAEHWFGGFSRNHRFEIENGVVSYRSRNGSDEMQDFVREIGLYPGFVVSGDPCKVIFGAFETTFRDGVNPVGDVSTDSIAVAWIQNFPGLARNTTSEGAPVDTLVMTTEANVFQQIDPVTMEPIELFTAQASHPLLPSSGLMAAHAAHADDGSIYNYLLDMSAEPPVYRIWGLEGESGEARILANITDAPPAYIHTLFSTENYLVLIVWQADYTANEVTLMASIGPWDPERKSLFYVIDRLNGGVVAKFISDEAFFAFHQINSFEDESGSLNIDLPVLPDLRFLEAANTTSLRANLGPKANGSSNHDVAGIVTRYRLPLHGPATHGDDGSLVTHPAEVVFRFPYDRANMELPRINDAYARKEYRYSYGVHCAKPGYFADSLIKLDMKTGQWKVWEPCTPQLPSEPIFVAAPEAENEDDGVLLFVTMNSDTRASSLVVLNAITMEEMGRAHMPIVMGYGFHGTWGSAM